jgi:hypothetical protein
MLLLNGSYEVDLCLCFEVCLKCLRSFEVWRWFGENWLDLDTMKLENWLQNCTTTRWQNCWRNFWSLRQSISSSSRLFGSVWRVVGSLVINANILVEYLSQLQSKMTSLFFREAFLKLKSKHITLCSSISNENNVSGKFGHSPFRTSNFSHPIPHCNSKNPHYSSLIKFIRS